MTGMIDNMNFMERRTIAAPATPKGTGALSVIRLSGPEAFVIADKVWAGRSLSDCPGNTVRVGRIVNAAGEMIDQGVATVFRAPASFTGEDTVEFSLHGSEWIVREVMGLLVDAGAAPAEPGEFSRMAYLNGKLDLAQAEGIADLIASRSRATHRLAVSQLRGTFSRELNSLRDQLVELDSLLELELDFSEEDVEFADRRRLLDLTERTLKKVRQLADSYRRGKAFKEGIPVVIVGQPNAGKSTLLNNLLQEDRAIVSAIAGTTRDVIEDTREIEGILVRFQDTAGLRDTEDEIEREGIERARALLRKAAVGLWIIDLTSPLLPQLDEIEKEMGEMDEDSINFLLLNKSDLREGDLTTEERERIERLLHKEGVSEPLSITAQSTEDTEKVKEILIREIKKKGNPEEEFLVTNLRHREALEAGAKALEDVKGGLEQGLSGDLIAQDIRQALHHLGELTGAITTDTLLASIFENFCIGK